MERDRRKTTHHLRAQVAKRKSPQSNAQTAPQSKHFVLAARRTSTRKTERLTSAGHGLKRTGSTSACNTSPDSIFCCQDNLRPGEEAAARHASFTHIQAQKHMHRHTEGTHRYAQRYAQDMHMHANAHTYTYTYAYAYTRTCIRKRIRIYAYTRICIRKRIITRKHICKHAYAYAYAYACAYSYTYTYVYTQTRLGWSALLRTHAAKGNLAYLRT
jgi:hypothetical protein